MERQNSSKAKSKNQLLVGGGGGRVRQGEGGGGRVSDSLTAGGVSMDLSRLDLNGGSCRIHGNVCQISLWLMVSAGESQRALAAVALSRV